MDTRLRQYNQHNNEPEIEDDSNSENDSDFNENELVSSDEENEPSTSQTTRNPNIINSYKNQAQRQKCRFGFPHPLSATTHIRTEQESRFLVKGDRELIIKRSLPG